MGQEQVARFVNARLNVNSAAQGHATFLRWQFERPLWILAAIVALVLLAACSNVANLLLARAAARSREMGHAGGPGSGPFAPGGTSARRMQFAGGDGVRGRAGSRSWTTPALISLMGTARDPAYLDVQPNGRVLAFLAFACLATTSLFGLAPALRASAANSAAALKESSANQSARTGVLRTVLAAQVGFSFTVLFVAGLLLLLPSAD